MKTSSFTVLFASLALVCAALSNGALAATPLVIAANGQTVGSLVSDSGDGHLFALFEFGADPLALSGDRVFAAAFERAPPASGFVEVFLDDGGLRHPYAPYVYFDRRDCTGQALLSVAATHPSAHLRAAIAGTDSQLYIAQGGPSQEVAVASRLDASGCSAFAKRVDVYPADAALALRAGYPPPYRVVGN